MICRICFNEKGNQIYVVKEMMFGYRDKFEYFLCSNCGCLQIKEYPHNIEKYYPSNYYSFEKFQEKPDRYLIKYLRHKRAEYCLTGRSIIGKFIEKFKPKPLFFDLLRICNANKDSTVLDVGCGSGHLLYGLHRIGFKHLTGIDPYITNDIKYQNSINVLKTNLKDLDQEFDLILLMDSLEHIPQQLETLKNIYRLLKIKKFVLINIPVIGYAWRHYGVNWVELDAPRHYYLHTIKSIKILSEKTGFEITNIIYNSNEFQFVGSEQYKMDIPMFDKRSYFVNPSNQIFSDEQLKYFKDKSVELNKNSDGDRVNICLRKKISTL